MLVHVIITYDLKTEEGGDPSTMWVEVKAILNVHAKVSFKSWKE
jgi:hypothetical protein